MNHLNFRIDDTYIKNHKVVKGFYVLGQRSTDYNWELLREFGNMGDAKKYIKTVKTLDSQRVYGPDGYGIRI